MLLSISALATLAICASTALSLPQGEAAEKLASSTKHPREDCDLRLWVRADDLMPSTIVEGDVRLLNNMTNLSPDAAEGCRILRWSLHLRHRERAAIQIPLVDAPLPERPAYNYTWDRDYRDRRRYGTMDMLSEGTNALSLFANVTDPYEEEKKAYYRQMEEYVRIKLNADNWIVREDEATLFDIQQEASASSFKVRDGLQISSFPFGIAVPHVRFPEANLNSMIWTSSGTEEDAKIKSNEEMDLSYFAEIHLANGSAVEVMGGKTKFFVPGDRPESDRKWTTFTLEEQSDCQRSFGRRAKKCTPDVAKEVAEESKLVLVGGFEAPAIIRRGEKMHVQGKVALDEPLKDKYVLRKISFSIDRRRKRAWAVEQIELAGSATNRTSEDVEYLTSSFRTIGGSLSSVSSAIHVQEELKKYDDKLRRVPKKKRSASDIGCRSLFSPDDDAVSFTTGTSFELDMMTPNDVSAFRNTLFAKEELEWVINVEAKERCGFAKEPSSGHTQESLFVDQDEVESTEDLNEAFRNDTAQWTERDEFFHRWGKTLDEDDDMEARETGASVKGLKLNARVPLTDFTNPEVSLRKRSPLLARLTAQAPEGINPCQGVAKPPYYLDKGAQAPIFVDVSSDAKIREAASLILPCSLQSESFPLVNRTATTSSHNPKRERSSTGGSAGTDVSSRLRYRKTKYERPHPSCKEGYGFCGGAASDVGTVWANKVILPKLKAVMRRGNQRLDQEQGQPFVLQTQM